MCARRSSRGRVVVRAAVCAALTASALGVGIARAGSADPVSRVKAFRVSSVGSAEMVAAVDSRRGFVYVAGADDNSRIAVVNERTGAVHLIKAGSAASSVAVSLRTGDAYIPDGDAGAVTVMKGDRVLGTVKTGAGSYPDSVAVNQSTGRAYVIDEAGPVLFELSGTAIRRRIPLPGAGSAQVAVDSVNGLVYVLDYGGDAVYVLKGATVVGDLTVGRSPSDIAIDNTTGLAYVVNQDSDNVSVISADGKRVIATVQVGGAPQFDAANPKTGDIYVANQGSNSVSVLKRTSVVATVAFPTKPKVDTPYLPSVDPSNGIVAVSTAAGFGVLRDTRLIATRPLSGTTGIDATDISVDRVSRRLFLTLSDGELLELQGPAAPRIDVSAPRSGGRYLLDSALLASYHCVAGVNNRVTRCDGTVHDGHPLFTGRVGQHTFTVHAHSAYGSPVTRTVTYRVIR